MSKASTIGKSAAHTALYIVAAIGIGLATAGDETMKTGGTTDTRKATVATPQLKPQSPCVAHDSAKSVAIDTTVKMAKCPMMSDSCKKKCAMMGDSCRKKCQMMGHICKGNGCYTCTMHPDVMKKEPGKCPKCGMDLVFKKCVIDTSKAKGHGGCCKMKK